MKKLFIGAIASIGIMSQAAVAQEQALTVYSSGPDKEIATAIIEVSNRQWEDARERLEDLLGGALSPGHRETAEALLFSTLRSEAAINTRVDVLLGRETAIDLLRQAEKLRPNDVGVLLDRAYIHCKIKQKNECNQAFAKAVDMSPIKEKVDRMSAWALAHASANNNKEARYIAQKALQLHEQTGAGSGLALQGLEVIVKTTRLTR